MGKIGILLAQLGTPDAPTTAAVRRYLAQFLADRRVVDLNPLIWKPLLYGIILRTRPSKSAELYRKVWTGEGSPLLVITRAQAAGLHERLQRTFPDAALRVEVAMRYGNPSTPAAVARLCDWGAERILLFPMYPQYSAATTGSTYDETFASLSRRRFVPALRVVPPYFDDHRYIDALGRTTQESLRLADARPDLVVVSFHGIPERYAKLGDPYPQHCEATARALAGRMGWREDEYLVTYQSRFGKEPWLQPYTDVTFLELGARGIRRIAVVTPGFPTDCLETIDEIGNLGAEQFRHGGGESLHRVECLNDSDAWLDAMAAIARDELQGWL